MFKVKITVTDGKEIFTEGDKVRVIYGSIDEPKAIEGYISEYSNKTAVSLNTKSSSIACRIIRCEDILDIERIE